MNYQLLGPTRGQIWLLSLHSGFSEKVRFRGIDRLIQPTPSRSYLIIGIDPKNSAPTKQMWN